jgi:hypothetical protein
MLGEGMRANRPIRLLLVLGDTIAWEASPSKEACPLFSRGAFAPLLAELRRALARTRVILITPARRTFDRVRAQDFGAERCLTKPFRHAQLRSAVEAALAR